MSFSENLAMVVADQLERFVTLIAHQLAGHLANRDFGSPKFETHSKSLTLVEPE